MQVDSQIDLNVINPNIFQLESDFYSLYKKIILGLGQDNNIDSIKLDRLLNVVKGYLDLVLYEKDMGKVYDKDIQRIRMALSESLWNMLSLITEKSIVLESSLENVLHQLLSQDLKILPIKNFKYRLRTDWFLIHIEQWEKDLQQFIGLPNLNFLEVGSYEGLSACWVLENVLTHESSKLTCLDPFLFPEIENNFDYNINLSGHGKKVKKMKGFSQKILRSLHIKNKTYEYYDHIYIDGSHVAPDVLEDAVLAWGLLKKGGIITFDDYQWQAPIIYFTPLPEYEVNSPKISIDSFLKIFKGSYELLNQSCQVTIKKIK